MTNTKLGNLLTKAIMDSTEDVLVYQGMFAPTKRKSIVDGDLLKAKINVVIDMLEESDEQLSKNLVR